VAAKGAAIPCASRVLANSAASAELAALLEWSFSTMKGFVSATLSVSWIGAHRTTYKLELETITLILQEAGATLTHTP
jgi:hypothetical protein